MNKPDTHRIEVGVETSFIDDQSDPDADRYVFAYTITISNTGSTAAKLLNRHWLITDATLRKTGTVSRASALAASTPASSVSSAAAPCRSRSSAAERCWSKEMFNSLKKVWVAGQQLKISRLAQERSSGPADSRGKPKGKQRTKDKSKAKKSGKKKARKK